MHLKLSFKKKFEGSPPLIVQIQTKTSGSAIVGWIYTIVMRCLEMVEVIEQEDHYSKFTKDENDLFDIVDHWLWRDCFVFVGLSDVLLFPCAYFTLGGWFTSTTFITSCYTHRFASSYLKGYNFLTTIVSPLANSLAHSFLLSLWVHKAQGDFTCWR